MFDEKQIVQLKWSTSNKRRFVDKGYTFTKIGDLFDILARDLSDGSAARVKVVCDYCGIEYETQYDCRTKGYKKYHKDACSHCASLKANEINHWKRASKKFEVVQKICDECDYQLITSIDKYTGAHMEIEFICKKHGKQKISLENFTHGHRCRGCGYESVGGNLRHDIEYVENIINETNGCKLLNPDEYSNTFERNLKIQCACGKVFTTSFSNFSRANVNSCFSCSCKESSGEKRIRAYLENNNVSFVQEKRFKDCRDIKPLPFDFYLPDYNLIVEFDGKHHFEEILFGNHESTKRHDKIKNKYCIENNIDILRIPYWEGNSIEEILDNKLDLGKRYSLVS